MDRYCGHYKQGNPDSGGADRALAGHEPSVMRLPVPRASARDNASSAGSSLVSGSIDCSGRT